MYAIFELEIFKHLPFNAAKADSHETQISLRENCINIIPKRVKTLIHRW